MKEEEKINNENNDFEFCDFITGKKLINPLNKKKLTDAELDKIFLEE